MFRLGSYVAAPLTPVIDTVTESPLNGPIVVRARPFAPVESETDPELSPPHDRDTEPALLTPCVAASLTVTVIRHSPASPEGAAENDDT